jgi:hypothetical protein
VTTPEWPPPGWADIEKAACPQCHAAPGDPCVKPGGRLAEGPHLALRYAATDEGPCKP